MREQVISTQDGVVSLSVGDLALGTREEELPAGFSASSEPCEHVGEDLAPGPGMSSPPVVVRIAGLSAEGLEALSSPPCVELLRVRETLEPDLAAARASIVDAITVALTEFDAMTRRFLLAVKRDCFNGRNIGRYRQKGKWDELLQIAPQLAKRVVTLEGQLAESDRALTALYRQELTRQRRHVVGFVEDRRFLRGVALGRPGLVRKIRSRAPSLVASGFSKRSAKWEQSLLRFVTRAAAKLSANSTLTSYALGSIQALPSPLSLRLEGSARQESSLVRLNRPALEQLLSLLVRHPAVREHCLVAWNDSFEEIEPGRYRFVRDGHWGLDPGAEEFHYVKPARITINLSSELVGCVGDSLREGALRYDALLAVLRDRHGSSTGESSVQELRSSLDLLVDIGALVLMPPWPTHEPRLEQRLRRFLRAWRHEPTWRAAADALDDLLALEEGFASSPRPERQVAEMEKAWARLIDTVLHLAGHEGPVSTPAHFFEDVLLAPAVDSGDDRGIVQIGRGSAQEILHVSGLVLRFADLFNHRHDVQHTLAAWWREHEPTRRAISFVELARRFAPIWKQFLRFQKTASGSGVETFDPLHAASLAALRERRAALLSQQMEVVSASPRKDVLTLRQLEGLVESLPRRYAPLLPGARVFVQPVDAGGSSWVLNSVSQATGRYLSRVTQLMEGPLRQRFLDHLVGRSTILVDGEEADLLEVKYPWGSLVRAHPPQTAKVLDVRGLHLGLPPERRVSLGELTVRADLDSEIFRVIGPDGRRLLPVQLSTWPSSQVPNLLRVLLAFGPAETRSIFPFGYSKSEEELRTVNRLTCGKVVIRRRSWTIGVESLREKLQGLADSRAFIAIHEWRRRLGLPSVVFFYEDTCHGKFKPQYIDFGSPLLCNLFVSSLRKNNAKSLFVQEALPAPTDFPFDASMNRRGLELLIDALALRTVGGNLSAGVFIHDGEGQPLRKEQ